jgi:Phosphodiester glycosidase
MFKYRFLKPSKKMVAIATSLLITSTAFYTLKSVAHPVKPQKQEHTDQNLAAPQLEKSDIPEGTVYTLKIAPNDDYSLKLGISPSLQAVDSNYWQSLNSPKPILVINAGFFDPANQLTSSFMTQEGKRVGNPKQNPHLMENPKLKPYLPQIMNRSEFRVYRCGSSGYRFEIGWHQAPVPIACIIDSAVGAGPLLLPNRTDREEAFVDYDAQGHRVRDPIGVDSLNARTAVGINDKGEAILMMVTQHPDGSGGVNLSQLTALMKEHGAVKAIALDGGSSSSLRYKDEVVWGKINSKGQTIKRPVKSVLLVSPKL